MQSKSFQTEQEHFWAGEFGDEYINRNQGNTLLASNLDFFVKALKQTRNLSSCIEFGANIGMNLKALQLLFPKLDCYGIEINSRAAMLLAHSIPAANVHNTSLLDFVPARTWDLTLIKGVLIHLNPEILPTIYD